MTKVNEVIKNLRAEKVEFRTEEDVSEYINKKNVDVLIIKQPKIVDDAINALQMVIKNHAESMEQRGYLTSRLMGGMTTCSVYAAHQARETYAKMCAEQNRNHWGAAPHFSFLSHLFDLKNTLMSDGANAAFRKINTHHRTPKKGTEKVRALRGVRRRVGN